MYSIISVFILKHYHFFSLFSNLYVNEFLDAFSFSTIRGWYIFTLTGRKLELIDKLTGGIISTSEKPGYNGTKKKLIFIH